MLMFNPRVLVCFALTGALLAGCAGRDDPNRRAKVGAGVGAVAGAVLGHQVSHGSGKWVGAAVGALAGAGIGHYMDNQEQEFEQELAAERAQNQVEIEKMRDETLRITLDSEISFDFDSAAIRPGFAASLDKLANVINKYEKTVVHVVGYTDSTGAEDYNQRLSERRAESVASYLESRGVAYQRLRAEGRGEREPRATNATEAGRQLNRRVEIYIKPIVEEQEDKAYERPRYGY